MLELLLWAVHNSRIQKGVRKFLLYQIRNLVILICR